MLEFDKKRMAIAVVTLVVAVLSAAALGANWLTYELKSGSVEVTATLWRYQMDGKGVSEKGRIKEEIQGSKTKNYRAFEFARFEATFLFISLVLVGALYAAAAVKESFQSRPKLEFGAAMLLLLDVLLAWAAAGYFKERQENNPWTDASETKEEAYCAVGCGLTILNGLLLLNLAAACLALLVQEGTLPFVDRGERRGSESKIAPQPVATNLDVEKDVEMQSTTGEETKESAADKGN